MRSIYVGTALMALVTLMCELVLTRVFDVIITPNMSYLVITCAMFAFGLSGVVVTLRGLPSRVDVRDFLAVVSGLFGLFIVTILPLMNLLPFDHQAIPRDPRAQTFYFGLVYLALATPFFLGGMYFAAVFSTFSTRIQSLYFWDLSGAALGSVIFIPFLPVVGAGGLLFCAAGLAWAAAAVLARRTGWRSSLATLSLVAVATPFVLDPLTLDFRQHAELWLQVAKDEGALEFQRWDPIAKIEVIDVDGKKRIAYDGGGQLSFIFPFDGDYAALRRDAPGDFESHFWGWGTLAAHYMKRDSDQRVLVIGGGGGQETKAALMFGSARVDVVELVPTVVELAKGPYAAYSGGVYDHPNVHVLIDEGRNALRHTTDRYDVIQIYSNHTSSSIAAGTGAVAPTYLQTAEAYREYFDHLTDDGILQINHYLYPRMITTAALAWRQMGRDDFQSHVAVFAQEGQRQPTTLFKMSPWTPQEFAELDRFFRLPEEYGAVEQQRPLEDPIDPRNSLLSPAFYSGDAGDVAALQAIVPYRITPTTDDRPYFKFWRTSFDMLEPSGDTFVDSATAAMLNRQMLGGAIPMDTIHLVVTGVVSLFFVVVFIIVPLLFTELGDLRMRQNASYMAYFACLGAGFIIFELVFIQVFMHFIGSPLYTYSTVLFTMLLAAGLGSMASERLGANEGRRWVWPFVGIVLASTFLLVAHRPVFDAVLGAPTVARVLVSGALIFPLGFFLGMPFPLGILQLEGLPKGAVAWAWGLNGLFTVVGGLASVLLSVFLGFQATLTIGVGLYVLAFALFAATRRVLAVGVPSSTGVAESVADRPHRGSLAAMDRLRVGSRREESVEPGV